MLPFLCAEKGYCPEQNEFITEEFTKTLQLFTNYINSKLFTKVIQRHKHCSAWLGLEEGELKAN
jgi:hypothetical protein